MSYDFLKTEERIALRLKKLYKSYGYTQYKLPGFEEYSLYAENGGSVSDSEVVAFNAGGKLLALRPDVTLSLVKNVNVRGSAKLFYDEKVYRLLAGVLKEVSQIGVEIIGKVDGVARAELCSLMTGTLETVGRNFVIEASHMGIILKTLEYAAFNEQDKNFAIDCLSRKNAHDFSRFAALRGVPERAALAFKKLIAVPSEWAEAERILNEISEIVDIRSEISELGEMVSLSKGKIKIDFSIAGDVGYYNGIIFKGYVEGVPCAVLSGGRYDNLLTKFCKSGEAVGFALYLGELGRYLDEKNDMPDIAVIYDDNSQKSAVILADELRKEGKKTMLCRELPQGFTGEIRRAEVD